MSEINLHTYEAFLLDYFEGNLNDIQIRELKGFVLAHPELEINLEDRELIRLDRVEEPFNSKNSLKKINAGKEDDDIIAYLENQLNAQQKLDFEKRLKDDLHLFNQLNAYKKTILKPDQTILFNEQHRINKTDDDFFLNNQHIAYLEGLLTEDEKRIIETELKLNIDLQKEFSAYKFTYLQKDTAITYPNKAELKRENKIFILFDTRTITRIAAALFLLVSLFVLYLVNKPESLQKNTFANQKVDKPYQSKIPATNLKSDLIAKVQVNSKQVVNLLPTNKIKNFILVKDSVLQLADQVQNQNTNMLVEALPKQDSILDLASQVNEVSHTVPDLVANKIYANENKQFITLENIVTESEDEEDIEKPNKNKFWKRLVSFGNKAKNIGIKGFEAENKEHETYFFAINNFSLEKK